MDFASLPGNLARVREEIARVQSREGIGGAVRIVAVTKGHPVAAVAAAFAAGLTDVGENRVQEALDKVAQAGTVPVTWHLIGHLQTNKARHVPGRFGWVHSVDSIRVGDALARAVAMCNEIALPRPPSPSIVRLKVLVQVNVAGEEQKSGCPPPAAGDIARHVAGLPELELMGLMTMAPLTDDERAQRRVFAGLRLLRDQLAGDGLRLPELSMGMSGDYRAAVAEGATMLRLGTVLFGERAA
jgi:pyridoxal phosphate enzyme (YggS family)